MPSSSIYPIRILSSSGLMDNYSKITALMPGAKHCLAVLYSAPQILHTSSVSAVISLKQGAAKSKILSPVNSPEDYSSCLNWKENATRGSMYNTSSPKSDDGGFERGDNGKTLRIHIPHFGGIISDRSIVSKCVSKIQVQPDPHISSIFAINMASMSVSNMLSPA